MGLFIGLVGLTIIFICMGFRISKLIKKKPMTLQLMIAIGVGFSLMIIGAFIIPDADSPNTATSKQPISGTVSAANTEKAEVTAIDFSTMDKTAIQSWGDSNKITLVFEEAYSDSLPKRLFCKPKRQCR